MYFFDEPEFHAVFFRIESVLTDTKDRERRFLSSEEISYWHQIRPGLQRDLWLAGRIGLKTLWHCFLHGDRDVDESSAAWSAMNVVSRNNRGKGVSPVLAIHGKPVDRHFSLSHSDFAVLAVLSKQEHRRIGCDLVPVGSFSGRRNPFVFHESEQELIRRDAAVADHLWAVKEAVYKATSSDCPFAPLHWLVERLDENVFVCRSFESDAEVSIVVPTRLYDEHVMAVAEVNEPGRR